jgi:hypothetical protein
MARWLSAWAAARRHLSSQVCGVAADACVELLGQGQDHLQVGPWQEFLTPFCQPHPGVIAVALGATAVAAGVVGLRLLAPGLARSQVPAQGRGPAVDQIAHGAAMAGQKALAKPLLIVGAIAPPALRHRWPDPPPAGSAIGPEGVEGGVYAVAGCGRQMRVAGSRTGAFVAEPRLHDAQRPAAR